MFAASESRWRLPHVELQPAQVLVLGFAFVILVGATLLALPSATESGEPLRFVDALFTSTSAVCVTGLVVVDTATTFSPFGELVILLLIQIGGLGIMSMSTLVALIIGRRITFRERLMIRESLGLVDLTGMVRLVRYVLTMTMVAEGLGALGLFLAFLPRYPAGRALYLGVFHSVSAFNNAGFDVFSTSLTGFVDNVWVNLIVMSLIILGGIGFTVVAELVRRSTGRATSSQLSLHTKLTLIITGLLIAVGAFAVYALEYDNPATLGNLSWGGKVLASLFLSVTPRTAGFNTVATSALRPVTLFFVVFLMWVGGSPNSTAGGIKTTTFGTIVLAVIGAVTGKSETQVFRRRLTRDIVDRSWAIAMMSTLLIVIVTGILLHTERAEFLVTLFEATSAFGTVGLSTGLTPALTTIGRIVIVITMYAGRVGPLTLAVAVARRQKHKLRIRHPEEKIMVG